MSGWARYELLRREASGEPTDAASVFGGSPGPFRPAVAALRAELAACRRAANGAGRHPRVTDDELAAWHDQPPLAPAELRHAHKRMQDLALCIEMPAPDEIWPDQSDPTRWRIAGPMRLDEVERVHDQLAAFMARAVAKLKSARCGT